MKTNYIQQYRYGYHSFQSQHIRFKSIIPSAIVNIPPGFI